MPSGRRTCWRQRVGCWAVMTGTERGAQKCRTKDGGGFIAFPARSLLTTRSAPMALADLRRMAERLGPLSAGPSTIDPEPCRTPSFPSAGTPGIRGPVQTGPRESGVSAGFLGSGTVGPLLVAMLKVMTGRESGWTSPLARWAWAAYPTPPVLRVAPGYGCAAPHCPGPWPVAVRRLPLVSEHMGGRNCDPGARRAQWRGMIKSSSAVRMRRTRERRRIGLTPVSIELRHAEVAALTRMGLLAEMDKDDSAAIAGALGRLLDRWLPAPSR